MTLLTVNRRTAARRTGFDRDGITTLVHRGAVMAHPEWVYGVRKVYITRLRGKWRLVCWPPSRNWIGKLDPSGRPVVYHTRMRTADDPPTPRPETRSSERQLIKELGTR